MPESLELSLDDGLEDLIFVAEVCVERTATLLRGISDIVHRRIGKPNPSEELSCDLDHQILCFDDGSHA